MGSSCGEPLFHDTHRDILLNPQVIIEALTLHRGF